VKNFKRFIVGALLSLFFVACGGGDTGSNPTSQVLGTNLEANELSISLGEDKTINPNERILLAPTSIKNNSASITSYIWKEGPLTLATTESLSYLSSVSGDHIITLTIVDSSSDTASDIIKISVNKLLSIDIGLNNNVTSNIQTGETISFNSNVQNSVGTLSYSWSIDTIEQTGETANTFSSTFINAGSYTVSVTVTDSNGQTATGSTVITVLTPSNVNTSTTSASTPTITIDPLTQGLKAWYKFDGNSNDSSGNGNHGIDTNITYVTSAIDKGAKFDGNSSFILIPQSESLKTLKDKFTLSFWTKYHYTEQGPKKVVVHIANGLDVPLNGETGFYNYSNAVKIEFRIGRFSDENTSSISLENNATEELLAQSEKLVTFVVDGSKLSVYSNAELKASIEDRNNTYTIARPSSNWFIGNMGNVYYLNGVIDDMRLYNRALSGAEIQKLYELKK